MKIHEYQGKGIFKKHNIDSLQFENSNNYYVHNVEVYNSIFERVKKNLETQMKIAESELEIENRKLDSLRKIKKDSSILISRDTLKGLRKSLKKNIQIRKSNFKKQYKFFNKYKNYFTNPEEIKNSSTAWLAYPILINKNAPFSRKDFQIYLEKRNIQTRVVFTGNILRQPMMKIQ